MKRITFFSVVLGLLALSNPCAQSGYFGQAEEDATLDVSQLTCAYCNAIKQKAFYEKKISQEKTYGQKYGATNLSKIDMYKRIIMGDDEDIRKATIYYKKKSGQAIKSALCSDSLNCEVKLIED